MDIGTGQTEFLTKIQTEIYCKIVSVFPSQLLLIWSSREGDFNFVF